MSCPEYLRSSCCSGMEYHWPNNYPGCLSLLGMNTPYIGFGLCVTGPPGTLLFDRDQRSLWNNHYNCCFVRLAALGIYCTDFLSQMISQVKYPMQFMVYENKYQHSVAYENTLIRALSGEICLHWATMYWMTGIRNYERLWHLAGNDTCHYKSKEKLITEQETWNLARNVMNIWYLKPFLITMI